MPDAAHHLHLGESGTGKSTLIAQMVSPMPKREGRRGGNPRGDLVNSIVERLPS